MKMLLLRSGQVENSPQKTAARSGMFRLRSGQRGTLLILNETLFAIGRGEEEGTGFCLFALHAWTGEVLWNYRLPESIPPTVGTLVATEGVVYIQSEEKVEAIDTSTHLPRWTWQAPSPLLHTILADEFLYAFAEQGQIIALDAYQGELCWTWTMEGEMLRQWQACDQDTKRKQASFSTIAGETLYVVVGDTLYALR